MSIACQEVRIPPAVRIQRALSLAADELSVASLEDVIALASELCQIQIYPDFAVNYFRQEHQSYSVTQVRDKFLVQTLP